MSVMTRAAMSRRTMLGAIASSPLWMQSAWAQPNNLKISHQFPGGSISEGDFRDRLCRMFAADVERRTRGGLKFSIYPGSSLMAPNAQFAALRSGTLDMALVPLSYAGAEAPEANIGLMPGLVTSYEQGFGWKNAAVGKELTRILREQGLVIVSWIWQAGGVASRDKPILQPEDVAGLKVRGGAYWFMFEPLMMSRTVFDRLTKQQQAAVMAVGADLETFARNAARSDDAAVASVYARAGARVVDMNAEALRKWQAVARTNAWREYGERSANCAKLLELAEQTIG